MSITTPFLTEVDSRAQVKGSRDPLGVMMLWSHFGRRVVVNLTTVSTSLRDFTVRIVGQCLVERVVEEKGAGDEVGTFLRWEQLTGYARVIAADEAGSGTELVAVRGIERVRRRLSEGRRVKLSADPSWQLLGNQRTYGVLGTYSVPSASSGLLDPSTFRLTDGGREVASVALGRFGDAEELVKLLTPTSCDLVLDGRHEFVVRQVGGMLQPKLLAAEQVLYRRHLLHAGEGASARLQQQFACLVARALDKDVDQVVWTPRLVASLAAAARKLGADHAPLADRLVDIQHCESLLGPADAIFGWLAGETGRPLRAIAGDLRRAWGDGGVALDVDAIRGLRPAFAKVDDAAANRWIALAETLRGADYEAALRHLLDQNAHVMGQRGGPPWLELRDGKLFEHFHDEVRDLPKRSEVPDLWLHSYFLPSVHTLTRQIGGRP